MLFRSSLGFVLAVVVTPASVHDTKAAKMVLDRAVENGFNIERAKVDAIYTGPTIETVSGLHKVEFQISSREPEVKGFAPLPLRCRYAGASRPPSALARTATDA